MQVPDYDDESGVYLGPGRNFDDEDLEYLNKDVEEQINLQKSEDTPSSALIVDSVSGIYLGFEDKEESETEEEDPEAGVEETDSEDVSLDTVKRSKLFSLFKTKQTKYKVSSDPDMEGGRCFKFIGKVWKKAEVCQ